MNMVLRVFVIVCILIVSGISKAEPPFKTDYRAKLLECHGFKRTATSKHSKELMIAVGRCSGSCKKAQGKRAKPEDVQLCTVSYEKYRALAGYSIPKISAEIQDKYHVDYLTATLSVRNGHINRFKLTPSEQSKGASLAAEKCVFKLTPQQIQSISGRMTPERRAKLEQIRANGQLAVYKLTDINWFEDGTLNRYECSVGQVAIIGID